MNDKTRSAVPVLLGTLIAVGWVMTSVTILRSIGAF